MEGSGKLFVISAPSGAGKTTLIKKLLNRYDNLFYSISHTTRPRRKNEQPGRDYFFITPLEFKDKIADNDWLEWAKVHDNYYGTSKKFVKDCLADGRNLILDIDVQGAEQVMASGMNPVSIFILPPSFEVLSQRLYNRGLDSKKVIARRLENAKQEMTKKDRYQYTIVNDDLDRAMADLCAVFDKETACI